MGLLPHHLPWNSALLSAGRLNMDTYVDSQRGGTLCTCRYLRNYRARRHRIDHHDGSGIGCRASDHAMEHADEETGQVPGFWAAVLRVHCISNHHGPDPIR